ncbi:hypothetical protein GQ602_005800 [Ophiocordyceps camponoti-floridani]|uniref:YAG7-like dimerisation domain-containing protein n=1 Tax=Ophiocordyceps camponoti-floridani TaxID=2030778 RepID=A0A8H4VCB1_9HYPO|nr:hypothetical protein GQ602_005800 [Ophiocordyceps camponoti-floridani]
MAASAAHAASKPSKKKPAAKAPERAQSPSPSTASGAGDRAADSQDDGTEMPLIKELQKNIRNLNKKITNASKTDSLLAQHTDKSLDELVATKIINTDQKAQILKKPALKSQLAQMEEQLSQLHKVHDHYRLRAKNERIEWEKSLDKFKDEAGAETQQKFDKSLRGHLLVLSQFLRLAAYRREEAKDHDSDESQAIEGVLLAIYTGDENAVASMLKLIEGSSESILSVPGEPLKTTFSHVKALAQEYKTPFYSEAAPATEPEPDKEAAIIEPAAATSAATLPEEHTADSPVINGQERVEPATNGTVDGNLADAKMPDDAATAATTTRWEGEHDDGSIQEWVNLETPQNAVADKETAAVSDEMPATTTNPRSWADEQPDAVIEPPSAYETNDGFHQVQRNRGRQEREPGWRGRGRGEGRGRARGDGRGRGGGRGRGNGGGQWRPARRNEES